MKYFGLLLVLSVSMMQVACSDDQKKCAKDAACSNEYRTAAMAIAGSAAVAGLAQVAGVNDAIQKGQVPNTGVLPASITDAVIRARAAEVAARSQQITVQSGYSNVVDRGVRAIPTSGSDDGRAPTSYSGGGGDIIR